MHGFASRRAVVNSRHPTPLTSVQRRALRNAFTLIEVLVAMAVTLLLMGIVVTIFGAIGDNVSKNNSSMEMNDQLRTVKQRLQLDLGGVTAQMLPPRRDENGEGYFEIIEGPVGRLPPNTNIDTILKRPVDELGNVGPDSTVGDNDDMLMFTTRSKGEMFLGRGVMWNTGSSLYVPTALQSQVAEVAWFIRGTTLYRRQLLVRPDLPLGPPLGPTTANAYMVPQPSNTTVGSPYFVTGFQYPTNFYAVCDLSARAAGGLFDLSPSPPAFSVVANSLEDLTKRENRFAHFPLVAGATYAPGYGWPHDVRGWGAFYSASPFGYTTLAGSVKTTGRLGLPTLRECSSLRFPLPGTFELQQSGQAYLGDSSGNGTTSSSTLKEPFDAWTNHNPAWVAQLGNPPGGPQYGSDPLTGTLIGLFPDNYLPSNTPCPSPYGTRYGEDVILTHVLSFDVRVWDPDAALIGVTDSSGATSMFAPGDPGYALQLIHWAMGSGPPGTAYAIVGRGAYVDLYYASVFPVFELVNGLTLSAAQITALNNVVTSTFSGAGISNSGLQATDSYTAAVYDTGSWHYENDGINQGLMVNPNGVMTAIADEGTNGLDDNNDGVVDDIGELEAPPPYTAALRGIQIKIRCFDADSQEIREVTVVQEFVPD